MVWLVFLSVAFTSSFSFAGSFEKYQLRVGESIDVTMTESPNINVSRRGHLDFFYLGNRKWKVTALRSGAVMVSPAESSTEDFRVFFEVKPTHERQQKPATKASLSPATQAFHILINVELVSKKDLVRLGIPPQLQFPLKIESLEELQNQRIVAQPHADIFPRQELVLQSGGEFKTQYQTPDHTERLEGWKGYGLKLKVWLNDFTDKDATLDYDFSMSAATTNKSQLIRHHLKSRSKLILNQKQLIGALDTNTQESGQETFAYMQNIPIIGPILRLAHNQSNLDQIFIWFTLSPKKA